MGGEWSHRRNEVGLIEIHRADQHRAVNYTYTLVCTHGLCSLSAYLQVLHSGVL